MMPLNPLTRGASRGVIGGGRTRGPSGQARGTGTDLAGRAFGLPARELGLVKLDLVLGRLVGTIVDVVFGRGLVRLQAEAIGAGEGALALGDHFLRGESVLVHVSLDGVKEGARGAPGWRAWWGVGGQVGPTRVFTITKGGRNTRRGSRGDRDPILEDSVRKETDVGSSNDIIQLGSEGVHTGGKELDGNTLELTDGFQLAKGLNDFAKSFPVDAAADTEVETVLEDLRRVIRGRGRKGGRGVVDTAGHKRLHKAKATQELRGVLAIFLDSIVKGFQAMGKVFQGAGEKLRYDGLKEFGATILKGGAMLLDHGIDKGFLFSGRQESLGHGRRGTAGTVTVLCVGLGSDTHKGVSVRARVSPTVSEQGVLNRGEPKMQGTRGLGRWEGGELDTLAGITVASAVDGLGEGFGGLRHHCHGG